MAPSSIYCPPGGSGPAKGRVLGYLAELLQLSPADLRVVGIGLQATLSTTTPGTDTYNVPADQDLAVFGIQGYLRFPTLNSGETSPIASSNPDISERWFQKTQNCLVGLENTDRNYKVFDNRDVPMSLFTPPVGNPLVFPVEAPFLAPAGHRLRATFTLQDSTAAVIGSSTVYGILLTGVLIPSRGRT